MDISLELLMLINIRFVKGDRDACSFNDLAIMEFEWLWLLTIYEFIYKEGVFIIL